MYLRNIFSSFIDFIKSKYNKNVDQLKKTYFDFYEKFRITFLDDKIKNYSDREKNKIKIDNEKNFDDEFEFDHENSYLLGSRNGVQLKIS